MKHLLTIKIYKLKVRGFTAFVNKPGEPVDEDPVSCTEKLSTLMGDIRLAVMNIVGELWK